MQGDNPSTGERNLTPTNETPNITNNDVTLTNLPSNTTYDLSAHLINDRELTNNDIGLLGTTLTTDFVNGNISQNIGETTQTKLTIKINNNQSVQIYLNINKYKFDISGNNGTNATSQTIEKTPTNKNSNANNTDVSLNDSFRKYTL